MVRDGLSPKDRIACFALVALFAAVLPTPGAGADGYEPHGPYSITGNTQLARVAAMEGWLGSGSQADPYQLAGKQITAGLSGIYIASITDYLVISDNQLLGPGASATQCSGNGIRIVGSNNVVVANNDVSGFACGIRIEGGTGAQIRGNRVREYSAAGIAFQGGGGATILDNTVAPANAWYGIHLVGSRDVQILGNTVQAGRVAAVALEVQAGATEDLSRIANNQVRPSTEGIGNGIVVTTGHKTIVEGNDIDGTDNMFRGIAGVGPDGVVRNNIVRGAQFGIATAAGVISGNEVQDSVEAYFLGNGRSTLVEGNFAGGYQQFGMRLQGAGLVVRNNVIEGIPGNPQTLQTGIRADGSPGLLVVGNELHDAGITIVDAENVDVIGNAIQRHAVVVRDSPRTVVEDNHFSEAGINVDWSPGLVASNNFLQFGAIVAYRSGAAILNNVILDAPGHAVSGDYFEMVSGNWIEGAARAGIQFDHLSDRGAILDNVIKGGVDGIVLSAGGEIVVEGNLIDGVANRGLAFHETYGARVSGNRILGSGEVGVETDDVENVVIFDNAFENGRNVRVSGTQPSWWVDPRPGINIVGGPTIGGNYWADYVGVDSDGDGFGDTRYVPADLRQEILDAARLAGDAAGDPADAGAAVAADASTGSYGATYGYAVETYNGAGAPGGPYDRALRYREWVPAPVFDEYPLVRGSLNAGGEVVV